MHDTKCVIVRKFDWEKFIDYRSCQRLKTNVNPTRIFLYTVNISFQCIRYCVGWFKKIVLHGIGIQYNKNDIIFNVAWKCKPPGNLWRVLKLLKHMLHIYLYFVIEISYDHVWSRYNISCIPTAIKDYVC